MNLKIDLKSDLKSKKRVEAEKTDDKFKGNNEKHLLKGFEPPITDLQLQARNRLQKLVVSHRKDHGAGGCLQPLSHQHSGRLRPQFKPSQGLRARKRAAGIGRGRTGAAKRCDCLADIVPLQGAAWRVHRRPDARTGQSDSCRAAVCATQLSAASLKL